MHFKTIFIFSAAIFGISAFKTYENFTIEKPSIIDFGLSHEIDDIIATFLNPKVSNAYTYCFSKY